MESIHFIGIGGAGMSGIARVLKRQGVKVTGSDLNESPTLEALRREDGIDAVSGHLASNLNGATLVVVSAAIKKDNPEVIAAKSRGVPVISRAEMLGRLMTGYPNSIGISGTHGKTTTTGMTAIMLESAGLDPTVLIGGDLPAWGANARLGTSGIFLAEACEAYDSFLDLDPEIAVVTNIEADHLDYYGDLDNVLRSFRKYLTQVRRAAILCDDDQNVTVLRDELLRSESGVPRVVTYGTSESAMIRASQIDIDGPSPEFDVIAHGSVLGSIRLGIPGIHNVRNSLAAVAIGLELGIPFSKIAAGLAAFCGTNRRFERLGDTPEGVTLIDDYAHHPTEIRATLHAARRAYPDRRIIAVFQPHLPSRTRDLREQFAECFGDADIVVLTDIFLAREQPISGVTGAALAALTADRRGASSVSYVADKANIPAKLTEITRSGDVVLTLGAGDVRKVAEAFIKLSKHKVQVCA